MRLVRTTAAAAAVLAAALGLSSCSYPWVLERIDYVEFELVGINPKQSLRVSLLGPGGEIYHDVRIPNRRCSTWTQLQLMQRLTLPVAVETRSGTSEKRRRVLATRENVCPSSK